ncbi:hypothetical protein BV378_36915 [Nostoc sp. RF31YmG]|nr:hypothetical protein BV378_36915 [Nostoc sp. RF31YmG]
MQINAQINASSSQIRAESDRINSVIVSANADLRGHRRTYQEKQITTITEVQEANANVKIAQEELQVAQAELKSASANLRVTESALAAARTKNFEFWMLNFTTQPSDFILQSYIVLCSLLENFSLDWDEV